MSTKLTYAFLLLLSIILTSCKKDKISLGAPSPGMPSEYIKCKIDSTPYVFSYSQATDTFFNAYYYGVNQNQINLIRHDSSQPTWSFQIYFVMFQSLDSLQIPAVGPGMGFPGNIDMQLVDLVHHVDTMHGPNDNYNYSNNGSPIMLTLTSKSNDVLTGNFSGTLTTPTGLIKTITDGEFRIKIIRKHN